MAERPIKTLKKHNVSSWISIFVAIFARYILIALHGYILIRI